jgi:hypothetical protein
MVFFVHFYQKNKINCSDIDIKKAGIRFVTKKYTIFIPLRHFERSEKSKVQP